MAWSTPLTAVANATLTAAQWNASVRDNLLETSPALATAAGRIYVSDAANSLAERVPSAANTATAETTTSTSYTDLATVGPAITVTTGTAAFVSFKAAASNSTAGSIAQTSVAVSGATTLAAADQNTCISTSATAGAVTAGAYAGIIGSLTAGSNTFTLKYRATPSGTATFSQRHLTVIPF